MYPANAARNHIYRPPHHPTAIKMILLWPWLKGGYGCYGLPDAALYVGLGLTLAQVCNGDVMRGWDGMVFSLIIYGCNLQLTSLAT